jgi:AraC family transcriptional regulator of adaptative response/methylated-DNA-[protein]-cysteine methyltransferase
MIRAMRTCDSAYDGRFYVGVHSTGIYCLPSCPAKLPLLRNVVFYPNREEAVAAGLRGCKRCKSETFPDVMPSWYKALLQHMAGHPEKRLTEPHLVELAEVDISTIRRQFRRQLGLTPLAFHRRLRLERARWLIQSGEDYLGAAYDCGWESVSAFREAFKKRFGYTPGSLHVQC